MKRETVYRTQKNVIGLHADRYEAREILLKGSITRYTERCLFCIIPLKNKYKWKIEIIPGTNKQGRTLDVKKLTFESQKRVAHEKRELEAFLANKCKEYKNKE
nr:MAG TPA: NFACT protein [Caudoviricetes sp.]